MIKKIKRLGTGCVTWIAKSRHEYSNHDKNYAADIKKEPGEFCHLCSRFRSGGITVAYGSLEKRLHGVYINVRSVWEWKKTGFTSGDGNV